MAVKREEWDDVRETTLQTPRSVKKEGGEEVLEMSEQRAFPCSLWWRPWWGRLYPCSPWRSKVEQISTCSPWKGPHSGAGGCLKEAVTPWGAPRWSRLLPGPADPWREEPMLEQVCWQGLWSHAGAVCSWRTAPLGKDPRWGSLWRAVSREGDLTLEQGQSVRNLPPEEEGAAETTCDELTAVPPFPIPLRCSGAGGREMGVKLSPGRRDGWGEGVLRFRFYFSLSWSDLIGNKWN